MSATPPERSTVWLAVLAAAASVYFAAIFFVAIPVWLVAGDVELASTGTLGRALGGLTILGGSVLVAWLVVVFVRDGRGTHVPLDPPRHLVATGLYRWVRNPMYVLYVLIILGEALFLASGPLVAYAAIFWMVFHAYVVWREEPLLRRRFGSSYEAYCRTVPRWLPRPPRANAQERQRVFSPRDRD